MELHGRLAQIAELTPQQRAEMFVLMQFHYDGLRRDIFDSDMNEKQWAIILQNPTTGQILGFSTQRMLDVVVDGRPVKALFSGDTIVDRSAWGQQELTRIWGSLALDLIDQYPDAELYWFLIAKGYKTYRFLPVFFREFYPRFDAEIPGRIKQVRDALSRARYAGMYESARGIIEAPGENSCRLRPDIAQLTEGRLRDPHIRFFSEANPGHVRGDELCCVAPLTRANFRRAAYRVIGGGHCTIAESA